MAKFAAAGLAAVIVIGVGLTVVVRQAATREALRQSKELTRLAGHGIAEPVLTPAVLRGDRVALARLDRAVRRRIIGGPVVRVKIWDASGRIIYSDEPRLIGSRYVLGADERAALRNRGVYADTSDLTRPENRFDRQFHRLMEVYLSIRATDGTPVLYEDYERSSAITASSRRQLTALAPGLIGALVLLELIQVPLAWSLATRLRDRQREREGLLRRAIESSDLERRRIAADLHDGVVQRLAGTSFALAAAADRANGDASEASVTLRRAAADTRESIRELRTMLVDIYPPALQRSGLAAVVSDLAAPLIAQGIAVDVDIPVVLKLPAETEALLFRATQEVLRNTARHAHAHAVTVRVGQLPGRVRLTIADDGVGFDPAVVGDDDRPGHFGLRLLHDLTDDAGGTLHVVSAPGAGTTITQEIPFP